MIMVWPLYLLLPVAAASGWWAAKRSESEHGQMHHLSREYFVGLNYLLNEQADKAVDIFIKLLEVDSETVETHLALGSLFRRRGEVDRAIRIHQNLIARPQLSDEQRIDALMSLGRDYMSAGVFDRAEKIFQEATKHQRNEFSVMALQYLLDIYQQERAWEQAIATVSKIESATGELQSSIMAHHYCELTEESLTANKYDAAKSYLKKALSVDKNSVRASILQGKMAMHEGKYKAAIKAFKQVSYQDPEYISEIIEPIVNCYAKIADDKAATEYLWSLLGDNPRISVIAELADRIKKQQGVEKALEFMADQLSRHPSIRGLNQIIQWYIETTYGHVQDKLMLLHEVTNKLIENKPIYRCGSCGFGSKNLLWYCPGCKHWSVIKPIHGLEGD